MVSSRRMNRSTSERRRSCGNPSVRPPAYDPRMRQAFVVLAGLMMLNVVFQFVAAGAGINELGGDGDLDPHKMGANIAHLWPLLMIVVAAVGKLGKRLIITSVVIFLLVFFQYPIAENAGWLHPLVGLLIAFGTYHALIGAREGADRPASPTAAPPAPQNPATPTV
jgi:hypothetical protein